MRIWFCKQEECVLVFLHMWGPLLRKPLRLSSQSVFLWDEKMDFRLTRLGLELQTVSDWKITGSHVYRS